ncbi:tetratricopeptide repeat protein [Spirochaeta lutea]|nr:tetratricopeptide repeat protein [Spirochaeta lutea]
MKIPLLFMLLLLFSGIIGLEAQSTDAPSVYQQGIEAFLYNKPQEAIPLLEASLRSPGVDTRVYLYLGMAYEQIGLYEQALGVLQDGLSKPGAETHLILYNMGNIAVRKGELDQAMSFFNRAIEAKRSYAPAYLNRANNQVRRGAYQNAIGDYRSFIQLAPDHEQVPQVLQMIAALEGELRAQEQRRIAEEEQQKLEEAQREAEQRRIAQEQAERARQEAQRRQDLLNSVFNSLDTAAGDKNSRGAGADTVIDLDDELTIHD